MGGLQIEMTKVKRFTGTGPVEIRKIRRKLREFTDTIPVEIGMKKRQIDQDYRLTMLPYRGLLLNVLYACLVKFVAVVKNQIDGMRNSQV